MPAALPILTGCPRADVFRHPQRRLFEFDFRAQFPPRARANSLPGRFSITNDTAWKMPPSTEELVVSPREQRAAFVVLNQQIDIHKGNDSADEEKDVFGQALGWIGNRRFHGGDLVL